MAGQRSNQLNYVPTRQINNFAENLSGQGLCRFAYSAPFAQNARGSRSSRQNRL